VSNAHETKKTVLITGSAGLIGRAMVAAFRTAGYETVGIDIVPSADVRIDLAEPAEIEALVRGLDRPVHALINNAAIASWDKPIEETTTEDWDRVLNVNLRAPWLLTRLLLPHFAPKASILNIASIRNHMTDARNEPYSASKGGLVGLTQALAVELGHRYGIRVNAISPGYIADEREKLAPIEHAAHPARRVGKPEDIAHAAVYLCSDQAEFVTGAEWIVDGGMSRVFAYPV
jgi:NAD(P)-dependent dehydrogenase (short-subunit alcohol dehydrogenase family)